MTALTTARYRLDAVTEADTDAVFAYCQNEELQRYVPVPVPYTREAAQGYTRRYAPSAPHLWAIRSGDGLLGVVELKAEPARSAELGFWLGAPHRGHGTMTEAVAAVVGHGFDEVGLERIWWCAIAGNVGSAVVAKRNGFRFEGLRRRAMDHRGTRVDGWFGCLLRDDPRAPQDGWPVG
jgi:RimJ/RimL family protein N-acetyltransferase